jgi:addiction module HigA family antidote
VVYASCSWSLSLGKAAIFFLTLINK